jgi:hypothetical protein
MRTGRAIIISAVLALGAAAPIVASPAIATATAGHAPAVHVQTSVAAGPNIFYHT